jgi:hypothetical protein
MLRIPVAWLAALVISATAVTVYFYIITLPYAIPVVFPDGEVIETSHFDYVYTFGSAYPIEIRSNVTLDEVAWAKYSVVVATGRIPDGTWIFAYDARRIIHVIANVSGTVYSCYYNPDAWFGGAYLCSHNVVAKVGTYFYVYVPIPQIHVDVEAYNKLVEILESSARVAGVAVDKPIFMLYGTVRMYNATTIAISGYTGTGVLTRIPIKTYMQRSTTYVTFYPEYSIGSFYSMPDEMNYKVYRRAIYIIAFRPAAGTTARVTLSGGPGP